MNVRQCINELLGGKYNSSSVQRLKSIPYLQFSSSLRQAFLSQKSKFTLQFITFLNFKENEIQRTLLQRLTSVQPTNLQSTILQPNIQFYKLRNVCRGTLLIQSFKSRKLMQAMSFDRWVMGKTLPNHQKQTFVHQNLQELKKVIKTLADIGYQEKTRLISSIKEWRAIAIHDRTVKLRKSGHLVSVLQRLWQQAKSRQLNIVFSKIKLRTAFRHSILALRDSYLFIKIQQAFDRIYQFTKRIRIFQPKLAILARAVRKLIYSDFYSILCKESREHKMKGVLLSLAKKVVCDSFERIRRVEKKPMSLIKLIIKSIQVSNSFSGFVKRKYFKSWNSKTNLKYIYIKRILFFSSLLRTRLKQYFIRWNQLARKPQVHFALRSSTKAKILMSCSIFKAKLNIKKAFYRWLARDNKQLIKKILQKVYLYMRIQKDVFFYRLCSISEQLKIRKFNNLSNSKKLAIYLVRHWLKNKLVDSLRLWQSGSEKKTFLIRRFFNIVLRNQFVTLNRCVVRWKKIPHLKLKKRNQKLKGFLKPRLKQVISQFKLTFSALSYYFQTSLDIKFKLFNNANKKVVGRLSATLNHWHSLSLNSQANQKSKSTFEIYTIWKSRTSKAIKNRLESLFERTKKEMKLKHLSQIMDLKLNINKRNSLKQIRKQSIRIKISQENHNQEFKSTLIHIFNRLLSIKVQSSRIAFKLFHAIPDLSKVKKRANCQQLQFVLFGLTRKSKLQVYTQFKICKAKKQKIAIWIATNIASKHNRMLAFSLQTWSLFSSTKKTIEKTKFVMQFFKQITSAVQTKMREMTEGRENIKEKGIWIERLIKSSKARSQVYYQRWKKVSRFQSQIQNKKMNLIKLLGGLVDNSQIGSLKIALHFFKKNSSISNLQLNFFNKLLNTKFGALLNLINIWKSLPDPKNKHRISKATAFQQNLLRYIKKTLILPIKRLKEQGQKAQNSKKRAIKILVKKSSSELNKKFNRWKSLTINTKIIQTCRLTTSFLQGLLIASSESNRIWLLNQRELKLMQESINRIINTNNTNVNYFFKLWTQRSKILKMARQLNQSKKKTCTQFLQNFLNGSENQSLKSALTSFSFNMKIQSVIHSFFKSLENTRGGLVMVAFRNWHSLPERKDMHKIILAQKFQKGLFRAFERQLNFTIRAFKQQNMLADSSKKHAIRKLVEVSTSGEKRMFSRWANMNRCRKIEEGCRRCSQVLQILESVVSSNTSLVLTNDRQIKLKEQSIDKLIGNLQNNKKTSFRLWVQWLNVLKLQNSIQNEKKGQLLIIFQKFLSNKDNTLFSQTLQKFEYNSKVSCSMIKFFNGLNKTTFGQVVIGFKAWKQLPDLKLQKGKIRFMKMIGGLSKYMKIVVGPSIAILKQQLLQGQRLKRSSIINLMKKTMGGTMKYFRRWNLDVRQSNVIKKCLSLKKMVQQLNQSAADNCLLFLESERESEIKIKAINRLISQSTQGLRESVSKWKKLVAFFKAKKLEQDNNKKKFVTFLQSLIDNADKQQLKQTLAVYDLSRKLFDIQVKFFNKLLQSKVGMNYKLIQAWKSLPDKNQKQRLRNAYIFHRKLTQFGTKQLRITYKCLKNQKLMAQNLMKRAAIGLIRNSESGLKRYFLRWNKGLEQFKQLMKARLLVSLLKSIGGRLRLFLQDSLANRQDIKKFKISQNQRFNSRNQRFLKAFGILSTKAALFCTVMTQVSRKATHLKLNKVQRILDCQCFNQKQGWEYWKGSKCLDKERRLSKIVNRFFSLYNQNIKTNFKQILLTTSCRKKLVCKQMESLSRLKTLRFLNIWRREVIGFKNRTALKREFTSNALKNFNDLVKTQLNSKTKGIIGLFKKHSDCSNIIYKFCVKAVQAKQHSTTLLLRSLQTLPQLNYKERIANMNKFQAGLYLFYVKLMKKTLGKLLEQYLAGTELKRKSIFVLINKSTGELKQKYIGWQRQVQNKCIIQKIQMGERLFQNINSSLSNNLRLVFQDKNAVLMQKYIKKLIDKLSKGLNQKLRQWNKVSKQMSLHKKLKDEKKIMLVHMFQASIQKSGGQILKNALSTFEKNYKIQNLQIVFLNKLLQTGVGKNVTVLRTWKGLPQRNLKSIKIKAFKFQRKLSQFLSKVLKIGLKGLKQLNEEGLLRKKNCIRKLIYKSMNNQKKLFYKWIQLSKEIKITYIQDKINLFFQTATKLNLSFLFQGHAKSNLLKKVVSKNILVHSRNRQSHLFQLWKHLSFSFKSHQRTNRLNRLGLCIWRLAEKGIQEAFRKIVQDTKINIIRNYINSLWKWKISNNQTKHFSQMVRIMRQSQQLIVFTTLLNRRLLCAKGQALRNMLNYNRTSKIQSSLNNIRVLSENCLLKIKRRYLQKWLILMKQETSQYWKDLFRWTKNGNVLIQVNKKVLSRIRQAYLQRWILKINTKKSNQIKIKKAVRIFYSRLRKRLVTLKDHARFKKQLILSHFVFRLFSLQNTFKTQSFLLLKQNHDVLTRKKLPALKKVFALTSLSIKRCIIEQLKKRIQKSKSANKFVSILQRIYLQTVFSQSAFKLLSVLKQNFKVLLLSSLVKHRQASNRLLFVRKAFSSLSKNSTIFKLSHRVQSILLIAFIFKHHQKAIKRRLIKRWQLNSKSNNAWLRKCVVALACNSKLQSYRDFDLRVTLWRLKAMK